IMRYEAWPNAIEWTGNGQDQTCPARQESAAPDGNTKKNEPKRADHCERDDERDRGGEGLTRLIEFTFRREDQIGLNPCDRGPDQEVNDADPHEYEHRQQGEKKTCEAKPARSVGEAS